VIGPEPGRAETRPGHAPAFGDTMAAMAVLRLAALLLAGLFALPARAAPPDAAPIPAPVNPADLPPPPPPPEPSQAEAGAEPATPAESPPPGELPETSEPPGDDEPRLLPGELPPPRAIAVPPARTSPKPLLRRSALTANVAGLARAPFGDHVGTWRMELALERAMKKLTGSATGIVSVGQLRTDGRDDAWVAEIAGQYRWYFLGRFDRGVYAAGTLGFWAIDPYLSWALGGGLGLKHTGPGGLTLDLQAGLQIPVQWFRHDAGGNPPGFRDAWRTLLPGVLLNAGWSFDEAKRTRRRG